MRPHHTRLPNLTTRLNTQTHSHTLTAAGRLSSHTDICCLSNPQNLNISELIGSNIEDSPFYKILSSDVVEYFTMLANVNTPIHSRLW